MTPTPRKPAGERLVVGLGAFAHDTAVALMRGGRVLFAAEQERFDRIKHTRALPADALAAGLSAIGATFGDIDDIVLDYDPRLLIGNYLRHLWRHLPGSLRMAFDWRRYANALRSGGYRRELLTRFASDGRHLTWHEVRHHTCHAASAWYPSPFERGAVLTCDALGEFESVGRFRGEGTRLELLDTVPYPHSLAAVYSAVTDHLGFEIYGGEGKVMGLAAYGFEQPPTDLDRLVTSSPDGGIRVDPRWFTYHRLPFVHERWTSARFARRFGPRRERGEPLSERHASLAAGLQRLSDRVIAHLGASLCRATGHDQLGFAGGSALNGYSNAALLTGAAGSPRGGGAPPGATGRPEFAGVRALYVQPAANDAGAALGAAMYHSHHTLGLPRPPADSHTYLGPAYSDRQCERALADAGLPHARPVDLDDRVATLLAAYQVVGWFQGRMEFGPRALGNRSLFAHPGPAWMREHLNRRIKRREPFRPLAPIVTEADAGRFFALPAPASPFMLLIVSVRPPWRERLAAITHVDGTTRPQTVSERQNPAAHRLLRAFERRTGLPVLLNTSFNGPGEPIVQSPAEAIASARRMGLDALVLGPFLAILTSPSAAEMTARRELASTGGWAGG